MLSISVKIPVDSQMLAKKFSFLRTRFETAIPEKLIEKSREFLEINSNSLVPPNYTRLIGSIRVNRIGDRTLEFTSPVDYLIFAEEDVRGHWVPMEWLDKHEHHPKGDSYDRDYVSRKTGTKGPVYVPFRPGTHFIKRSIEALREEVRNMGMDSVDECRAEAGL